MAVKIRLTRLGDKKTPFYRIVVADSRKARDGQYIDQIGTFNPIAKPEEIKVDMDKANKWLLQGAQPTDTAKALLKKANVSMPIKAKKTKKTAKTEKVAEKATEKATEKVAKKPATKTVKKTTKTTKAKAE